jgi:HAD superfamily hydrolase (TIGR01509 family)
MLTNMGQGGIDRWFKPGFLDKYFDAVVASGDVGYAKPQAQIYQIMADSLAVRLDECLFTDDRQEYCDGATAVGMKAILYKDFDQFKKDLEQLLAPSTDN